MSNTPIKGPGEGKRPRSISPETTPETVAAQQPAATKGAAISRVKKDDDRSLREGETTTPDAERPSLPRPTYFVQDANEAKKIQENFERFTTVSSYDSIKEVLTEGAEKVKKRLNDANQEIKEVLSSDKSFEYKLMQVQQILASAMQSSLEVSGEYSKFISDKQADARKEAREQREKELEREKKSRTNSLITNIFAAIGDFFNMIAAAVTVFVTVFATGASAGATGVALVGALLWLSGAVMGFAGHVNGCLPKENQSATFESTGYKATQGVLTVLGMIMTMGASSYAAAGQASAKAALEGASTANIASRGILSAADTINKTNPKAIADALLDAARRAKEATDALLTAAEVGKVPADTILAAVSATQTLEAAMGAATLPAHFTEAMLALTKAAQAITKLSTLSMAQIETAIANTKQITTILRSYQAATALYSATTDIVTKNLNEAARQEAAAAEALKAQQDALLSQFQFISESINSMMANTVEALTELQKDTSAYLQKISSLGQTIVSKFQV